MKTKVKIAKNPFASGAMRHAFQAFDLKYDEQYVVKRPIKISEQSYNLEVMEKDLESLVFCRLIVEELNERLISKVNSQYLLDFVQSFIYQIIMKDDED